MNIGLSFILAFIFTLGFAVMQNAAMKTLIPSCISGGLGWLIYNYYTTVEENFILAGFLAALIIGILGEIYARRYHKPSTVFILPALLPLVPGAGMYYFMTHLISEDYDMFIRQATETFFIAASISLGLIVASLFSRSLKRFTRNKN